MSSFYRFGSVSVGTTPTLIAAAPSRNIAGGLKVTNSGSVTVYLGGPNVAASGAAQGFPLAASGTMDLAATDTGPQLYGIVATTPATVAWIAP